jgi:hypothetical protein
MWISEIHEGYEGFKKERRLSVLIAIFAEMLAYFVVKGFLEVRSDPQVRAVC